MGCVPHGMRSSFRDWCGETGVSREMAAVSLGMLETAKHNTTGLQVFLSLLALRIGAPAAYHALLLDNDSVFDTARALGSALTITQDDRIDEILNWHHSRRSNGPLEGTNNLIQTLRRTAHGFTNPQN